jgi:hypothetical protein
VLINGVCKAPLKKAVFLDSLSTFYSEHSDEINEGPQAKVASFRSGSLVDQACFDHWLDDGGHGGHHRGLPLAPHEYLIEVKVCKYPKAIVYIKYTTNKQPGH